MAMDFSRIIQAAAEAALQGQGSAQQAQSPAKQKSKPIAPAISATFVSQPPIGIHSVAYPSSRSCPALPHSAQNIRPAPAVSNRERQIPSDRRKHPTAM